MVNLAVRVATTRLACKFDVVGAADYKSVFSFPPARMVFEMRRGCGYFHMETGFKTSLYLHNISMIFYN